MSRLTYLQDKYSESLPLDDQPWDYMDTDGRRGTMRYAWTVARPQHLMGRVLVWDPRPGFAQDWRTYDDEFAAERRFEGILP